MSHSPSPVLIVGGGPSGLVLALALLQNGVPVRIIEKQTEPRLGQRGAGIMPRSLELFHYLHIIDDVMKQAIHVPLVRKYKMPEGVEVFSEFAMSPRMEPTPTNPFLNPMLLGQDRLEQIFHAALAQLGCTVEKGTELRSFQQFDDHVEVKLIKRGPDGDQKEHETAQYEWIVGTDGSRSLVRKQSGLTFLGETRRVENFVVGDIYVDGLSAKYWHMWGDASDVLISLRPTEASGLFNFIIAGKNIRHAQVASSDDSVRECFREHTGNRPDLKFGQIPWMSTYTPSIRMVEKFGNGRVFVAGDAGHVHSPTGGQGMNTGIQDSFNLGWKLALVAKGHARPSLLDTYTEERIPVIAEMLDQTTKLLKKTFTGQDEIAWKRGGGLFQLGVNYRWSSIVMDDRKAIESQREAEEDALMEDFDFDAEEDEAKIDSYGTESDGQLCAGDRAPDATGLAAFGSTKPFQKMYQLFEIFGPSYHTALIFADMVDSQAVLKAVARYPKDVLRSVVIVRHYKTAPEGPYAADHVLEDCDGHAYDAYTSGVCGLVLVRPDGVVGAILRGPHSLHRYFLKLFAS